MKTCVEITSPATLANLGLFDLARVCMIAFDKKSEESELIRGAEHIKLVMGEADHMYASERFNLDRYFSRIPLYVNYRLVGKNGNMIGRAFGAFLYVDLENNNVFVMPSPRYMGDSRSWYSGDVDMAIEQFIDLAFSDLE
jgi:hypothetical protein